MLVMQSSIFDGFCYIAIEVHENCYSNFKGCCGQSIAKAGIWYNMGKIMKRKILVVEDVEADFETTLLDCQRITLRHCKETPLVTKVCGRALRLIAPLM